MVSLERLHGPPGIHTGNNLLRRASDDAIIETGEDI